MTKQETAALAKLQAKQAAENARPNGASKVVVQATVGGTTADIHRDVQRLTTQTPARTKAAKRKAHDVSTGGTWTRPISVGLIYDEVEAGSGVEMTRKACDTPCKAAKYSKRHECRTEDETSIVVVGYVLNTGYSAEKGSKFTRFVPLYDADAAKDRKRQKLQAQLAALDVE